MSLDAGPFQVSLLAAAGIVMLATPLLLPAKTRFDTTEDDVVWSESNLVAR